jgi:adenylate kinase
MRIVLMGAPGAGKGTVAATLKETFGMVHLSSGDIFRAVKASGSELGQELARYMDAGQLVPDELVVKMMAHAIAENDESKGLMLDGFPRTVPQAEALDAQLDAGNTPLDAVVVLNVDDEAVVERITGRRRCPQCGKGFHVKFMPSARGEFCDECEGDVALEQRDDDTEATVRERLKAYYDQTEPVIGYYRSAGRQMIDVDGNKSPSDVADNLINQIRSAGLS